MKSTHVLLVLLCVATLAIGQVLFKLSARSLGDNRNASALLNLAYDPWFILALVLYASATLLWIWILRQVPLTVAYPFFALTFVLVPLLSRLFLGESVDLFYWIGVGLIIAGITITIL